MTLGRNQEKILNTLKEGNFTLEELSEKSGVKLSTTKNILLEFYDAEIVRRIDEKYYSLKQTISKPKTTTPDESFWAPVKLKNLSRII